MPSIYIFEDQGRKLLPLTWTRPVGDLRCGATTIAEHGKRGTPREIKYLWDLITHLKEDLEEDFKILGRGTRGKVHSSVIIYKPENVLIEEGAEIEAGAVLDARGGPIYIGKNSIIRPTSYLKGPVSIGPECRIGGEVTHSIFHGYSNKQHYGFIGHSYIGEWVNLGAGTTNSNLKNNYSSVKVYVNGKMVDSGELFVGIFVGDHAKSGINTMFNTGTVVGVSANVFGSGFPPKFIPSFSWGGALKLENYDLEKAIETAKAMMSRREKKLSEEEERILRKVYELTTSERTPKI